MDEEQQKIAILFSFDLEDGRTFSDCIYYDTQPTEEQLAADKQARLDAWLASQIEEQKTLQQKRAEVLADIEMYSAIVDAKKAEYISLGGVL